MTAAATAEASTHLATLRRQISDLRERLKDQRATTAQARTDAADGGSVSVVANSLNAEDVIKAQIEDLQYRESTILNGLSSGAGKFDLSGALGERLSDPGFTTELAKLAHSSARIGDLSIGDIPREEVLGWAGGALNPAPVMSANGIVTPTDGMTQGPFQRVVPLVHPQPRFLDLVPTSPMETPSFPYAQEIATTSAGPAPTPINTVKPEIDFDYQDAEANPATIAGWLKISRLTLADVPALGNVITTRMTFKARVALEHEILSGNGSISDRTGKPGIVGLLNTPGVGSISLAAGELPPDAILDGITDVLVNGAVPNVIALNPLDWSALLKTKATGSGEYVASPFLATAEQVWGVTLTPAVGVPQGKVIVGDTRIGMTFLVREGANLRVSDADQDSFIRNQVTMLCELRGALAVWVPAAFVVVDLSPTSG